MEADRHHRRSGPMIRSIVSIAIALHALGALADQVSTTPMRQRMCVSDTTSPSGEPKLKELIELLARKCGFKLHYWSDQNPRIRMPAASTWPAGWIAALSDHVSIAASYGYGAGRQGPLFLTAIWILPSTNVPSTNTVEVSKPTQDPPKVPSIDPDKPKNTFLEAHGQSR